MKAQVVGVGQRRSGMARKTGREYDGTTVHVLTNANDVQGQKAEQIYFNHMSEIAFPAVVVGDLINIEYNRQGFIEEVTILKKAN